MDAPRRRLSKNLVMTSNMMLLNGNRTRAPQHKKWPLLVRSLSDSAKYRRQGSRTSHSNSKTETKALTLSLSDSRLFTHKKSSLLDIILNDKDPETCSCGCDQDLEPENEEFSEDEGCFVITSVPQSQEEEVTNKVKYF